jgi:hypothetical protein
MKIKFSGEVEVDTENADGIGCLQHWMIAEIYHTIQEAVNTDEIYDKLKLKENIEEQIR